MNDEQLYEFIRSAAKADRKASAIMEVRRTIGCGLREAKDYVESVLSGHKPTRHAALNAGNEKPRIVKIGYNRSPSYMDMKESKDWAIGADYGARETLAAIQLFLKERNMHSLADELPLKILIEE